jgi:Tol biopolymer transport system component
MKHLGYRWMTFVSSCLLILAFSPSLLAQTITVTSANPNNAPQGRVNLNVLINGKNFKKGAISKFFISGTADPGGITVNSTSFISSGQLNANINIAADATATQFDIVVALSDGRSGKGTKLFAVTVPDPAIAYLGAGLMVMNADGTNQMAILQPPNPKGSQGSANLYRPNWSPDGSQLVFESNIQGTGIYVINKDGTGLRKVIANRELGEGNPVWSPAPAADDQWKIAFVDLPPGQTFWHDIFLVNLDGTGLVNLTNTSDRDEFYPTWDPFATRLAAQSWPTTNSPGNTASLYEFDLGLVNGVVGITGTTDLTAAGPLQGVSVYESDWAKTQDKIVLSSAGDLWVVSLADPANPQNITGTLGVSEVWPSWSPDDSKIVYRRMVKSKVTISVINADGSAVVDLANGDQPEWRRCGPTGTIPCAP